MSFWSRVRLRRATETATRGEEVPADSGEGADEQKQPSTVAGERGVASISGTRSLQARLSNVLAAGLMAVLAIGFLAWYYTQTFARQSRTQAASESRSRQQAKGEMTLPPLGRVDPPVMEQVLGPPPDPPLASLFAASQMARGEPALYAMPPSYGRPASAGPEQTRLERRLAGPVFVSASSSTAGPNARSTVETAYGTEGAGTVLGGALASATPTSALTGLLEPTATPVAHARVLPTQRLLLPKGAFLDCTLETAIDSSLPGMTTCITATDTFGADGSVVLLERGTKLVGETRGDVRHGTARVYVLWTEARTPEGVVVPLASPGSDELGRAGLPGEVNRHFWERFGAAILVSVIDGAVQAAVQRSSDGNGTVVVNPSTSRDVMTEVLRSTINIPPTVTKPHGDRIAVLVARDLDFRSVYDLRPTAANR